MKKRQSFTDEFKLEAVRLLEQGNRPAAEVARELGVRRNQLYKWQEELGAKGKDEAFPDHERRSGTAAGMDKLRRENVNNSGRSMYLIPSIDAAPR
jgi:transposase-like protein